MILMNMIIHCFYNLITNSRNAQSLELEKKKGTVNFLLSFLKVNKSRKYFLKVNKSRKNFLKVNKSRKSFLKVNKSRKSFLKVNKSRKSFLKVNKSRKSFPKVNKSRKSFPKVNKSRKNFIFLFFNNFGYNCLCSTNLIFVAP